LLTNGHAKAYRKFDDRQGGCTKVLVHPGR